jgi:hypothetical protein
LRSVRDLCLAGYREEGKAGCSGVGLAVVPGQNIAGLPGPAGDGAVAYLLGGGLIWCELAKATVRPGGVVVPQVEKIIQR